jgi:hypothetical protein
VWAAFRFAIASLQHLFNIDFVGLVSITTLPWRTLILSRNTISPSSFRSLQSLRTPPFPLPLIRLLILKRPPTRPLIRARPPRNPPLTRREQDTPEPHRSQHTPHTGADRKRRIVRPEPARVAVERDEPVVQRQDGERGQRVGRFGVCGVGCCACVAAGWEEGGGSLVS